MRSACWRAVLDDELKRLTVDVAHKFRFVRKADRIVLLLAPQRGRAVPRNLEEKKTDVILLAERCRCVAHLPTHAFRIFSDATLFLRIPILLVGEGRWETPL